VACGRSLDRRAPFCAWCGASQRVIHLDATEAAGEHSRDVALGSGRRWLAPTLVIGVIGVLIVGTVASGSAGGKAQPAPTTAATAPATTTSTTTARTTLAIPATIVASTVAPARVQRFTPFAGVSADTVLVGLADSGLAFSARLAAGEVMSRTFELIESSGEENAVLPGFSLGERAVFNSGADTLVVPARLDARVERLPTDCGAVGPAGEYMWVAECDGRDGPPTVAFLAGDGTTAGPPLSLPADTYPFSTDGRGSVIVGSAWGFYVVGRDGQLPSLLTRNELLAVSGRSFVERACDEHLVCRVQVVDRTSGGTRALPLGSGRVELMPGALSPGGRWLVVANPNARSIDEAGMLIELSTGATRVFPTRFPSKWYEGIESALTWTGDDSYVFWMEPGAVRALDVATGATVQIGQNTVLDRARGVVVVNLAPPAA